MAQNNISNVNVNLAAKGEPRPTITPAWTSGNSLYFISVDFRADGFGNFRFVATLTDRHVTEEWQCIDCALEDAEDFAADLVSDARGFVYQTISNAWETGDLVGAVRDLVTSIEARKVA
jgi:hypothetical protein